MAGPATLAPPTETAAPAAVAPVPGQPESPSGTNWLLWGALAGLAVVAAAAALLLKRRQATAAEVHESAPVPPAAPPEFEPSPPAALNKRPQPIRPDPAPAAPEPAPAATQPVAATPQPPRKDEFLDVTLTARRMSATLMNTALTYELVVTNKGPEAIGPISVNCDMIGAHASLPPRVQLENPGQGDPVHRVPRLEPGESAAMSGELRLPLAAITPIRHGQAALFVPLARFRLLVWREGKPPISANRTFVIGETPATPNAALKPFRLDLGPRMYSSISQREVAVPA